ncbi:uncharacterized protein MYCFIDRAFT_171969 [Pseudocercospora fijiensis CIRAD86]|uniref:Uncharacterized protein n=1 Tax=Pseudocercospora fijiensis (strain CIRAD86) TaxID=383855 RepID=M3A4X3_PSEFD|nr:uncharacterized protein MYCFIDRAFT_171969 [Pseudocercospora fijiensis CIRAD86]EME86174.1 hypothetical protein MYCFIDRAFT_171969 [Pseudocercospora fijiensis CIRAD86]
MRHDTRSYSTVCPRSQLGHRTTKCIGVPIKTMAWQAKDRHMPQTALQTTRGDGYKTSGEVVSTDEQRQRQRSVCQNFHARLSCSAQSIGTTTASVCGVSTLEPGSKPMIACCGTSSNHYYVLQWWFIMEQQQVLAQAQVMAEGRPEARDLGSLVDGWMDDRRMGHGWAMGYLSNLDAAKWAAGNGRGRGRGRANEHQSVMLQATAGPESESAAAAGVLSGRRRSDAHPHPRPHPHPHPPLCALCTLRSPRPEPEPEPARRSDPQRSAALSHPSSSIQALSGDWSLLISYEQ